MPFTNFDSRHFTAAEKNAINAAIATLENALTPKLAELTPEERQQYGSVNEQNKLIINKVKSFRDSKPALSSPDVDWVEFSNDFDTREFLQTTIMSFQSLVNGLGNAKILHDWDNYQASLNDYDYAKYKAGANVVGYSVKVEEIGQFFAGRPTGSTSKTATQTPDSDSQPTT